MQLTYWSIIYDTFCHGKFIFVDGRAIIPMFSSIGWLFHCAIQSLSPLISSICTYYELWILHIKLTTRTHESSLLQLNFLQTLMWLLQGSFFAPQLLYCHPILQIVSISFIVTSMMSTYESSSQSSLRNCRLCLIWYFLSCSSFIFQYLASSTFIMRFSSQPSMWSSWAPKLIPMLHAWLHCMHLRLPSNMDLLYEIQGADFMEAPIGLPLLLPLLSWAISRAMPHSNILHKDYPSNPPLLVVPMPTSLHLLHLCPQQVENCVIHLCKDYRIHKSHQWQTFFLSIIPCS